MFRRPRRIVGYIPGSGGGSSPASRLTRIMRKSAKQQMKQFNKLQRQMIRRVLPRHQAMRGREPDPLPTDDERGYQGYRFTTLVTTRHPNHKFNEMNTTTINSTANPMPIERLGHYDPAVGSASSNGSPAGSCWPGFPILSQENFPDGRRRSCSCRSVSGGHALADPPPGGLADAA